ncbi:MAG: NAD(P)/FAD-dependent oxidoreductase, partial [Dehalococcoidia bacterium]|nr:NAD(P)/FAD-dependent oxidoreductase [Dehalococcoidia bacterium]
MPPRSDYDVIVVGAGPAGGMAALSAARLGLRVAIIEEHAEVGAPAHCSGKLQLHAFREFDLPGHLVMNTLQAGAFYAPDGSVARFRRAEPDSHVVDRAVFDRWLADEAQRSGAELVLRTRLRAAERMNGLLRVSGERNGRAFSASAPLIIDAEGARPILPASLGLRLPRSYVLGLQYQMSGVDLEDEDCPEIYLGASTAPGFFAWLMPIGRGRGRVGLCVEPRLGTRSPLFYLERLIREHPVASKRLRGAVVERKLAGPIPVLGARRPSIVGGMLLVGDAAGQVKATSGGGIYFSLIAGRLAAQAARAFLGGDAGALKRYERQ